MIPVDFQISCSANTGLRTGAAGGDALGAPASVVMTGSAANGALSGPIELGHFSCHLPIMIAGSRRRSHLVGCSAHPRLRRWLVFSGGAAEWWSLGSLCASDVILQLARLWIP